MQLNCTKLYHNMLHSTAINNKEMVLQLSPVSSSVRMKNFAVLSLSEFGLLVSLQKEV